MEMSESMFGGYIDVKVPPKGRKFGPWKAWKKQWFSMKTSSENSFEVGFGNSKTNIVNSITISTNANICRTESRTRNYAFGIFPPESKYRRALVFLAGSSETESQLWMSRIRSLLRPKKFSASDDEFNVSLIDNQSSRCAGIYGTHGILSLNNIEMTIKDENNGEINVRWKWSQIEYAKLLIPPQNEKDTEKILVLHLVSDCTMKDEDCELQFYCESAVRLQSAISRYRSARQHRLMTSPLPPTPTSRCARLHAARRLSRSEGDLRWPFQALPSFHNIRSRSGSRDRNKKHILAEQDVDSGPFSKIAKTLISASFGLMLSTPGCSEPDTSHDYQDLSAEDLQFAEYQNVEGGTDDLSELRASSKTSFSDRRVSGTSIASGIYEEIEEQPAESNGNASKPRNESMRVHPPPLPPRKPKKLSKVPRQKSLPAKMKDRSWLPTDGIDCKFSRALSEPDYLPMSPSTLKHCTDDTYVVMSSLISQKNKIATEPVPL